MFAQSAYYMNESTIPYRAFNTIPYSTHIMSQLLFNSSFQDGIFYISSLKPIVEHFIFSV